MPLKQENCCFKQKYRYTPKKETPTSKATISSKFPHDSPYESVTLGCADPNTPGSTKEGEDSKIQDSEAVGTLDPWP